MTLPDPRETPLLKVAEFASYLPEGAGEKAVRAGVASGQIKSSRVGRYVLIPTVELYRLAALSPDTSEPELAGPGIA